MVLDRLADEAGNQRSAHAKALVVLKRVLENPRVAGILIDPNDLEEPVVSAGIGEFTSKASVGGSRAGSGGAQGSKARVDTINEGDPTDTDVESQGEKVRRQATERARILKLRLARPDSGMESCKQLIAQRDESVNANQVQKIRFLYN